MPSTQALLSNPASVGVWNIDPNRSTIGFRAKSMWGLSTVKGRFTKFHGDGQITDTQTIFGRIDIDTASLNTKSGKRDEHLRSADYFDAERFPDISVVVANVAMVDEGSVRLTTHTTVDRKDFGVDGNLIGMLTDKVTISGDVVFRRAG